MRINKFLSHCGLGSRRSVEELILQGRVSINGETIFSLAVNIDENKDEVKLDNKLIRLPEKYIYIVLNKPKNVICSRKDPQRRRIIYDLLPERYKNFSYAGRLDYNSRGLVLLSNDGDFIEQLNKAGGQVLKYYKVKIQGSIKDHPNLTAALKKGLYSGKDFLKVHSVWIVEHNILTIALNEGKNRHIRRMFEALNITIRDLYRYGIGNLIQGDLLLPSGSFAKIRKEHIIPPVKNRGKKSKTPKSCFVPFDKPGKDKIKTDENNSSAKNKRRTKPKSGSKLQNKQRTKKHLKNSDINKEKNERKAASRKKFTKEEWQKEKNRRLKEVSRKKK